MSWWWYVPLFLIACVIFFHFFLVKRFFAWFLSVFCEQYNAVTQAQKEALFGPLNELAAATGENYGKRLKVLEIGGGSGANFKFVKQPVNWTVTEPNLNFVKYFNTTRKKFEDLHVIQDMVAARGEDLSQFKDGSFDAVVISLVLCSVDNVDDVLSEVRRVLKPGGVMFYIEHIGAPKGTVRRLVQDIFTNSGFWPLVFDGCRLNRDTKVSISKALFSKVQNTDFDFRDGILGQFIRTQCYGRATKPADGRKRSITASAHPHIH